MVVRNWVLAMYRTQLHRFLNSGISRLLRPRLGLLKQHEPKPIVIPQNYHATEPPLSPPLISITTPTLNQGQFLALTMKSVLDQNYPRLEYVVQDGASTDGTRELLEVCAHESLTWESAPDRGQAHAINLGFKGTTGEIMAYLNSDDLLLPGCLNYVASYFERNPGVDVIYGHRVLIDEQAREIGRWILPPHSNEVVTWTDYVPQETLFWRRRIWDRIGGAVDEAFNYAMDWDLILRFVDAGAIFVRVPRFLGAFRVHEDQKTIAAKIQWGDPEVALLRERLHGRTVTSDEAFWKVRGYILRHLKLHLLYRLGIVRF